MKSGIYLHRKFTTINLLNVLHFASNFCALRSLDNHLISPGIFPDFPPCSFAYRKSYLEFGRKSFGHVENIIYVGFSRSHVRM